VDRLYYLVKGISKYCNVCFPFFNFMTKNHVLNILQ